MKRTLVAVVAVLALAAALATTAAAVGLDRDRGRPGPMGGPVMGMPGMHGMHGPGHGRTLTEQEYLVEMVAHHEEAVDAASELQRSKRAAMRDLGARIVESQTAQIELMREWLDAWYPGEPTETDYRPMMRDLSRLSGDRLDRAFLVDMIRHHMMAVMMSQHLLAGDADLHPELEALAEQIRDEQWAEIVQMRRWLRTWFGTRGRGPCGMGMGMYGPGAGMMRGA